MYTKNVLSLDELVDHIGKKGFSLHNKEVIKDIVQCYGYYHLSSYMKCFYQSKNHDKTTIPNLNFEQSVLQLFMLDIELSSLLFEALQKIEYFLKADFIAHTTSTFTYDNNGATQGDPYWYTKTGNIKNHNELMLIIEEIKTKNQKSRPIKHFLSTYDNPHLPIWHLVEVASLGSFTKLYNYIKIHKLQPLIDKYHSHRFDRLKQWLS